MHDTVIFDMFPGYCDRAPLAPYSYLSCSVGLPQRPGQRRRDQAELRTRLLCTHGRLKVWPIPPRGGDERGVHEGVRPDNDSTKDPT